MSESDGRPSLTLRVGCVVLGLLLLATGVFVVGGARLASLHGSLYFLIAGVLIVVSAVQLIRMKSVAVLVYGVAFIGTLVWALVEVGLDYWPLVSRLMLPAGFMVLTLLTWPSLRKRATGQAASKHAYGLAALIAIAMIVACLQMFQPHPTVAFDGASASLVPVTPDQAQKNWSNYGNTPGGSRFVALDQITRENVKDLRVAWTFHTGDTPLSPTGNGAEDQETPLQIGDRIYLCTPHNNVIAVDADSGKQIWKREINAQAQVWNRCRGLAYFDATRGTYLQSTLLRRPSVSWSYLYDIGPANGIRITALPGGLTTSSFLQPR
ncbi:MULTISPECIES: PQQ-binding-like beta-propeller repeat protein [unclassified Caballeronia]|uniref:PQQ-binding-like beta-propeller repeat protein n=1 Tax=unclassified Caballeronia TaxID=2646786 RepID=UPI0028550E40|nr:MULTISPECIES: PQQ-binding-like beta-propeller repeat protein [unclassified Caballeronia]MDR5755058.1 PQQ-binding-like beta-propeller repeat protein [Caballeronia sp. LZ024]MDR5845150.1 PQQ-binding-like beta-propeller repeat protein [Caballeronia sp. LZ031]